MRRGNASRLIRRLEKSCLASLILVTIPERANRIGARAAVILGDDDIARGVAQVKNLATGEQEAVALTELAEHLR